MTHLGLRPYRTGDDPRPASVPVSVVVLTKDEEPNIGRCLTSVSWADQAVVIDCGSTDNTVQAARSLGAEVIEQPWLGFSGQREFALRLPQIRNDWVYFVDADEWVSPQLAVEIAARLRTPPALDSRIASGSCSRAPGLGIAVGIAGPGWFGSLTGDGLSMTGARLASERASTGQSTDWPTTSSMKISKASPAGCTSMCVTRNSRRSAAPRQPRFCIASGRSASELTAGR